MLKKTAPLVIVLAVAFFAAWPLLGKNFIPTHDGEYHLIRFYEFEKNIRAGIWWPRWAGGLNDGRGVPLFNFFYPLPNFMAVGFRFLGCSLDTSFRLIMAFGLIFGALFFYLWVKELFDSRAAMVGAVFYTLAPYHLLDVYVRGSVGEVLALGLFPAVLWAFEKKSWWASIFLALLILSHNILAFIFMPFLLSYLWFLHKRKILNLKYSILNLFLGLGLSAIFWLPALIEAKYVVGLRIVNFADHFPVFFQLIFPSWGSGFSVPGIGDQMSFQIGVPHLLTAVICLFLLKKKNAQLRFFCLWFLFVFILLLEISLPFWRLVLGMSLLQYPWRLLSLMILITSFLAAQLASFKKSKWLAVVLILLALVFYAPYARPVRYAPRKDEFYLSNPTWIQGTATLGNTFNIKWLANPSNSNTGDDWRQVNIAYFPGWEVFIDGERTLIDYQNGLINFQLPEGEHEVEVKFDDTPVRKLASAVSFLCLFFLLAKDIVKRCVLRK